MTALELTDDQQQFVEQFALAWESMSYGRMEGRIFGLFLIVDRPYLASADIALLLAASAGAVSMATRKLIQAGFLHRHVVPGNRQHHFAVADDVWGGFLKSERAYLQRLGNVISTAQSLVADQAAPRRRLSNAMNYLEWIEHQHQRLLDEWNAYRDAHDPEKIDD